MRLAGNEGILMRVGRELQWLLVVQFSPATQVLSGLSDFFSLWTTKIARTLLLPTAPCRKYSLLRMPH